MIHYYARYRSEQVRRKKCRGRTLSINWPLWEKGGMQVNEESEKMMYRSFGMTAMQTETGIEVFYQSISFKEINKKFPEMLKF